MIVRVRRVRRTGWTRHITVALFVLVTILPASLVGSLIPRPAGAYSWGQWTPYVYYPITPGECAFAKASMAEFIGPLSPKQLVIGCQQAVRQRTAKTSQGEMLIQIENVGPFGGYGMNLESRVSWDGEKVSATEPICEHWAVVVTTTPEKCAAIGNDTGRVFLRMDYRASWSFLWVSVNAGRGAQVDVSSTGWIGPVIRWP